MKSQYVRELSSVFKGLQPIIVKGHLHMCLDGVQGSCIVDLTDCKVLTSCGQCKEELRFITSYLKLIKGK